MREFNITGNVQDGEMIVHIQAHTDVYDISTIGNNTIFQNEGLKYTIETQFADKFVFSEPHPTSGLEVFESSDFNSALVIPANLTNYPSSQFEGGGYVWSEIVNGVINSQCTVPLHINPLIDTYTEINWKFEHYGNSFNAHLSVGPIFISYRPEHPPHHNILGVYTQNATYETLPYNVITSGSKLQVYAKRSTNQIFMWVNDVYQGVINGVVHSEYRDILTNHAINVITNNFRSGIGEVNYTENMDDTTLLNKYGLTVG